MKKKTLKKRKTLKLFISCHSRVPIKTLLSLFISSLFFSTLIARKSITHSSQPSVSYDELTLSQEVIKTDPWEYFYPFWNESIYSTLFSLYTSKTPPHYYSFDILSNIIRDPENRIESEFKIIPFFETRVLFWLIIQTQFNKFTKIVHDRNNLNIVYGYIDLEPLYKKYGPTLVFEKSSLNFEKAIINTLRTKLLYAIDESSKLLPDERLKIRAFLSRIGALKKDTVHSLINSIRTQTGQKDVFIEAINKSKTLLPIIENTFRNFELPLSLARLPFIESSFNINAQSKRGAIGIWQFMPETAEEHIHPLDTDLWSHPLYQTKGAARLLTFYRRNLPDWGITLTAYNSGIGKIKKIIKTYNIKTIDELIVIAEKKALLGFAGINFYPQFLAANLVEAYKDLIFK